MTTSAASTLADIADDLDAAVATVGGVRGRRDRDDLVFVLNRIRDELRRKGRRPGQTGLDGRQADEGESPLEAAIGREMVERYERALATLRPDEQEAIIARIEMGYSYGELADVLAKPSSEAARKAARRALVKLAEEMSRDAGRTAPR